MATQPTIQALSDPRFTDVVIYEEFVGGAVPFSRDLVSVNNAAGGTFAQGHLLWRAKGATATAAWDVVDAAGDINVANEYAVLIGDDFDVKESIVLAAGVAKNCIAITRKAIVKDAKLRSILKAAPYSLSDANVNDLKRLLATQGVLVVDSLTAITA